jgi:hypothetical protein
MILGFKTQFPDKTPTFFPEKILACAFPDDLFFAAHTPKKHTIRSGQRWKAGIPIHMATGVRSKSYRQFNKDIPGLEKVISVQKIQIKWDNPVGDPRYDFNIWVDDRKLSMIDTVELIQNDGFGLIWRFAEWFPKDFEGQLIHWTDLRY